MPGWRDAMELHRMMFRTFAAKGQGGGGKFEWMEAACFIGSLEINGTGFAALKIFKAGRNCSGYGPRVGIRVRGLRFVGAID